MTQALQEQIQQLQATLNTLQKQVVKEEKKQVSKKKQVVKEEKKLVEKVCPICGKPFLSADSRRKYCSKKCSLKAVKETNCKQYLTKTKLRRQDKAKSLLTERTCPICGNKFMGKANQKYCTSECKEIGRRETSRKCANKPKHRNRTIAIAKLRRSMLPVELIKKIVNQEVGLQELTKVWNFKKIKNYIEENNI